MTLRELITKISFTVDDTQLKRAEGMLNNFSSKLSSFGKGMSLAFTAPIVAVGTASVIASNQMEDLLLTFTTLTGSAAGGAKMLADIRQYAFESPLFDPLSLSESAKQMMGYGIAAEEVMPAIRALGDVAAAVGKEKMPLLAYALAQVKGAGRLLGQDARQFSSSGINIYKAIADMQKKTVMQVMDEGKKGLISYDTVRDALTFLTTEGRFKGAVENAAKTTSAAWGRMMERMFNFRVVFGDAIKEALHLSKVFDGLGNVLGKVGTWFEKLNPGIKTSIILFLGLIALIGPISIGIAMLIPQFIALGVAINTAIWPATLIIATLVALALIIDDFMTWQSGGSSILGDMFGNFQVFAAQAMAYLEPLIEGLKMMWDGLVEIVTGALAILIGLFTGNSDQLSSGIEKLLHGVMVVCQGLFQFIGVALLEFTNWLVLDVLPNVLKAVAGLVWNIFKSVMTLVFDVVKAGLIALLNMVANIPGMKKLLGGTIKSLSEFSASDAGNMISDDLQNNPLFKGIISGAKAVGSINMNPIPQHGLSPATGYVPNVSLVPGAGDINVGGIKINIVGADAISPMAIGQAVQDGVHKGTQKSYRDAIAGKTGRPGKK
jgi:hypothetical protein